MRKFSLTGALALVGLLVPAGSLAGSAAAGSASSVAPVMYHVPIIGKHVVGAPLAHGAQNTTTNVRSTNWSGYADTGATFRTLSSTWVEPTVNCTAGGLLGLPSLQATYSSFWVGLDGYGSSSVEQTGTDSDCTSSHTPSYYAWYEMYPAGSVTIPTAQYPVHPGDMMNGLVTSDAAGTSFTLTLSDATRGWTYSTTLAGSGLTRASAEFVAEAPSQCIAAFCRQLALADFGTVNFSVASVTDTAGKTGTISAFSDADIQMASQTGTVKATPSALSPDGSAFSVTWSHS
ncbi:MAG TPA: G1 family glutamic endopeptidase [Acidimicrobiales bacterium]|nr:G1 family glutamic endopeptidase [Acidimicrobiales bacterium]